jgi:hypothetical protein
MDLNKEIQMVEVMLQEQLTYTWHLQKTPLRIVWLGDEI